jgi:hypothetical protein
MAVADNVANKRALRYIGINGAVCGDFAKYAQLGFDRLCRSGRITSMRHKFIIG